MRPPRMRTWKLTWTRTNTNPSSFPVHQPSPRYYLNLLFFFPSLAAHSISHDDFQLLPVVVPATARESSSSASAASVTPNCNLRHIKHGVSMSRDLNSNIPGMEAFNLRLSQTLIMPLLNKSTDQNRPACHEETSRATEVKKGHFFFATLIYLTYSSPGLTFCSKRCAKPTVQ